VVILDNLCKSNSNYKISPGEILFEYLEFYNISEEELAESLDLSIFECSSLLKGDKKLTKDIAYKLELAGIYNAKFWENVESIYRR
jgi:plasmid maintenance system antidote protein VapI